MQEDQKPTMPTGEVENKKKATKLPLKAKVTKRQFSVERPRDTVYAISVVSDAIREHMQALLPPDFHPRKRHGVRTEGRAVLPAVRLQAS